MVLRRREYLAMGGLDPTLSLYFNDVDLCRRLWRAGRRIRYLADAEVHHHRGGSTRELELSWRTVLYFQNREAYFRKHYGWPGKLWLEAVLLAHAGEQAARITLGPQPLERSRASLRQLGQLVARCLRPAGMVGADPS
jgi:GT2 family glycosyltransferase